MGSEEEWASGTMQENLSVLIGSLNLWLNRAILQHIFDEIARVLTNSVDNAIIALVRVLISKAFEGVPKPYTNTER